MRDEKILAQNYLYSYMCFNFGTFFNTVPGSLYITSRLPHAFIDQLHPGLEVVVICIELRKVDVPVMSQPVLWVIKTN